MKGDLEKICEAPSALARFPFLLGQVFFWAFFRSWAVLVALGSLLGRLLDAVLVALGSLLGRLAAVLGRSWSGLGSVLRRLGSVLAAFGAVLGGLGSILGGLGASWGGFWSGWGIKTLIFLWCFNEFCKIDVWNKPGYLGWS